MPTWREQGFEVAFSNVRFAIGPRGLNPAQTAFWDGIYERVIRTEEWQSEVRRNDWALDYADSRQAPARMARLNNPLKSALADAGLLKE